MSNCDRINTDVLIIGAGVIGISVARELARYHLDVTVIDQHSDVGQGISKTSAGFINMGLLQAVALIVKDLSGSDPRDEIDTEMFQMLWQGFSSFDRLAHKLDIAHRHLGAIVIARNQLEIEKLQRLQDLSQLVPGGTISWLDRQTLLNKEPNLTPEVLAGLYDPDGTILVFGSEYVYAIFENTTANGVRFCLNHKCHSIDRTNRGYLVKTARGIFDTGFVINCAGKFADGIADQAGIKRDWNLIFFKGQAHIFDRRIEGIVNNLITTPPEAMKVDVVSPLLGGNVLGYGGNYDLTRDRMASGTRRYYYEDALDRMQKLVPSLSYRDLLTAYTGIRVFNDKSIDEHLIGHTNDHPNFISVVPRMPGFTPAPLIAQKVKQRLASNGLSLTPRSNFLETRQAIPRFRDMLENEKTAIIHADPDYGHVVCRCETVTKGEIKAAIQRGANTIQGIMLRTRAGMGRCQRDHCGPKLIHLLAEALGCPPAAIQFKRDGSWLVRQKDTTR